jgi:Flp pilus assembly protein TadD
MAKGPEAAVAAIEALELDLADSANLPALRALCEHLGMTGKFDRAVSYVDAALARTPDSAELNALLGETLATADRTEAARRAFERALEIDAEQPQALGGLGTLMGVGGDTTSAIDLLGRAADLTPNSEAYRYSAAQLLLAAGSREAAETSMREIIMRSAGHAASRNDLAWILAEDGRELDLALSLASEASRLSPEPEIFDTLGFVYLKRGEAALAVEALEKAVAGRPGSPSIRYRLGTALRQTGDSERARAMLTDALEAGAFPEAEAARRELALLAQG